MNKKLKIMDLEWVDVYEEVKPWLFYRICNADANRELLESVFHINYLDMAITFHFCINADEGLSTFVTNKMLAKWNVSKRQFLEDAFANAPNIMKPEIKKLDSALIGITPRKNFDSGMLVVTNTNSFKGASALFYEGVMMEISEKLGGDYYVMPSSVHEMICLSANSDSSVSELEKLVKSVNDSIVSEEDRLSDHVYRYDSKNEELVFARDYEISQFVKQMREARRSKPNLSAGDPGMDHSDLEGCIGAFVANMFRDLSLMEQFAMEDQILRRIEIGIC